MGELPFGPAFAPWSETEGERATAFRAFMAKEFPAGTPSFLQRGVEAKYDPLQTAYVFQRGLDDIPADRSFPDYLTSRQNRGSAPRGGSGQDYLKGLINQGAGLFQPGGTNSNKSEAFRQFLTDNQGTQFDLAKAYGTSGMPAFLAPSLNTVAQGFFDKWLTGLPQGEAASGVDPTQLNFLNRFQRSGFRF